MNELHKIVDYMRQGGNSDHMVMFVNTNTFISQYQSMARQVVVSVHVSRSVTRLRPVLVSLNREYLYQGRKIWN